MPITVPNINPLSTGWTHQDLVSESMLMTNTVDDERVHTNHVRKHLNVAIATIADLLNVAELPYYGIAGTATFETTKDVSGLLRIALPTSNVRYDSVVRVMATGQFPVWSGNLTKLDIGELFELITFKNDGWRNSGAWSWHGNDLLVFFGSNVNTLITKPAGFATPLYTSVGTVAVYGYRQPVLDNLQAPMQANGSVNTNSGFYSNIDLPDKHIKLCLQLVQKMIIEQIKQEVPAQLDAEINQAIQAINTNIANKLELSKTTNKLGAM